MSMAYPIPTTSQGQFRVVSAPLHASINPRGPLPQGSPHQIQLGGSSQHQIQLGGSSPRQIQISGAGGRTRSPMSTAHVIQPATRTRSPMATPHISQPVASAQLPPAVIPTFTAGAHSPRATWSPRTTLSPRSVITPSGARSPMSTHVGSVRVSVAARPGSPHVGSLRLPVSAPVNTQAKSFSAAASEPRKPYLPGGAHVQAQEGQPESELQAQAKELKRLERELAVLCDVEMKLQGQSSSPSTATALGAATATTIGSIRANATPATNNPSMPPLNEMAVDPKPIAKALSGDDTKSESSFDDKSSTADTKSEAPQPEVVKVKTSNDLDYGFTKFNFEESRAMEADNQAQHEVFGWLKWGPAPASPCYNALHKYFPGALPGSVVHARSRHMLENAKYGFTNKNTIFGTSICPDEINSVNGAMVEQMRDHWGGMSFPLGGISGAPFSGKTGFAAFSHHVPQDGNVFVVFGPHVSISENGEVGKISRRGIEKISTACGAVIGAYNACTCGDIDNAEFDKCDMQMSWIKSQIAPFAEQIKQCENPMAVLAHQAYEFVKKKVLQVVNNGFGKGSLAILGGIMINMPRPYQDHFLPLMFHINKTDEVPQDLMIAFRSRVSGEVLNDDGEACRRIQLYGKLLGQVELFRRVSKDDLQHAAASLVNLTYYKDEYIIEQGETGNTFFVLLVGEAAVEVDGHCVRQCHGCLPDTSDTSILKLLQQDKIGKVDSFGELSFGEQKDDRRSASIRITSAKAVVLSMSRDVFELVTHHSDSFQSLPRRTSRMLEMAELMDRDSPDAKTEDVPVRQVISRRRTSVMQAEMETKIARAREHTQATHHYVFSWLNWSPQPDSACYRVLHDQFPCAIPGPAVFSRSMIALEKFGFAPSNTIFGTSLCPDEINSRNGELVQQMKGHWGENFPLGGISGAPFSGKTGFTAFSHHAPDNGNVIVLFGPHVGISADGIVGKFLREGQPQLSTACGAVVGAYNACIANTSEFDAEFDETDMQMDWIKQSIAPHAQKIKARENSMAALAHKAYSIVEKEVEKVVSNEFGDGYLALIGVIQINMPKPYYDHFMPVKFEVRNKRESFDMMQWLNVH